MDQHKNPYNDSLENSVVFHYIKCSNGLVCAPVVYILSCLFIVAFRSYFLQDGLFSNNSRYMHIISWRKLCTGRGLRCHVQDSGFNHMWPTLAISQNFLYVDTMFWTFTSFLKFRKDFKIIRLVRWNNLDIGEALFQNHPT